MAELVRQIHQVTSCSCVSLIICIPAYPATLLALDGEHGCPLHLPYWTAGLMHYLWQFIGEDGLQYWSKNGTLRDSGF